MNNKITKAMLCFGLFSMVLSSCSSEPSNGKSAYELYIEQYPGYIWGEEQWIQDFATGDLSVVIDFNSCGGTSFESLTLRKGEEVAIEQVPEKAHASFGGWFIDQEYEIETEYTFTAEKSMTLYAKWTHDSASVVFKNKGAISSIEETHYYSKVNEPELNPIADLGYKFVGWAKEGSSELWDFNTLIMEDEIVLNAVYDYDFLEIPAVIINVDDGSSITSKEEYKASKVSILNTKDEWKMEDVSAGVRGRGNSSWTLSDKKPYRIKFDKKQSLFGSSYKAKSWTLIASHSDKTLSRNYIAYELSKRFSGLAFSSAHQFVDLYLNGEYRGVYLLCDQIQVGSGRVDIDESIESDGNNGYFIERDARAVNEGVLDQDYFLFNGQEYTIKSPDTESEEYLANKDVEIAYIKHYLTDAYNAITPEATLEELGAYIDVDSFIDSYIIDELFANNDCGWSSCYYYKDKDGVLFKGPIWDFDIGGGNVNYNLGNENECKFDTQLWADTQNCWYNKLLHNTSFIAMFKARLLSYSGVITSVLDLLNTDNEHSLYYKYNSSLIRNFDKWDIMGNYVWPEPQSVYSLSTVKEQFDYLYNWLSGRYTYMVSVYSL